MIDEHYERTIDLIRDAAKYILNQNATPPKKDDMSEIMRRALTTQHVVPQFLEAALRFPTASIEYLAFIKSEKEKHEGRAIEDSAAWFLNRLADQLTSERSRPEVDHSFVLPNSFKQYRETENWPKHHQQV